MQRETAVTSEGAPAVRPSTELLQEVPLSELFSHLNSAATSGEDGEGTQILCAALERLLGHPATYVALGGASPTLETMVLPRLSAGLSAGSVHVRGAACRFIHDLAAGSLPIGPAVDRTALYAPALLEALTGRLGDEHTDVADTASDALALLMGAPSQRLLSASSAPQPAVGSAAAAVRQRTVAAGAAAAAAQVTDAHCELVATALAAFAGRVGEAMDAAEAAEDSEAQSAASIVHGRVMSLVATCGGASDSACAALDASRLLSLLLQPLLDDDDDEDEGGMADPLLAVSACEAAPALALSRVGLEALCGTGIAAANGGEEAPSEGGGESEPTESAHGAAANGLDATVPRPGSAWATLLAWAGIAAPGAPSPALSFVSSAALSAVCEVFAAAVARDQAAAIVPAAGNGAGASASDGAVSNGSARPSGPAWGAQMLPGLCGVVQAACASPESDLPSTINAMGCFAVALAASPHAVTFALSPSGGGSVVREWLECGCASTPELRAATYASLARVLHGATSLASASGSGALEADYAPYVSLYAKLGASCGRGTETSSLLLGQLKAPLLEPRYAAYDLLAATSAVPSGPALRAVWASADLAAYLLDTSTETIKEGREWKFGVIAATARNPALPDLGDAFASAVRRRFNRGPNAVDMAAPTVGLAGR